VSYDELRRIIREEEPPRPSTRLSTLGQAAITVSARRQSDPKRLSQLCRGELDWIVMKALEKDRNRRYETASAFAADVQRYLHDEPVLACPPSALYRFRKFARRNKRTLAMLSVFTLAVLVALGSLVVSNARISGEAKEKTKALAAARASEQEARENVKDALAAVDQMLTRVSEERLRDVPQMEPLRRELLQDALRFYQKFLERRGDDPAIRRETALAYLRMASLHFGLGDYGKSEEAYRKAFTMFDELEAASPLEPSIRSQLVSSLIGFSWVLRNQGKLAEGEKALRRAVAVAEDLLKEFPDSRPYRDLVITVRNRLASAIVSPGLVANAQRTALEEGEQLLRRNLVLTHQTTSFWDRAQTYRNLGVVLAKQRRFSEAEDAYRQGILFFEKALANPSSPRSLQVELAGTLKQLATAVESNGRLEEAEAICRRVIPLFDRFAADFPAGPHNRWGQAEIHAQHAALLRKLKRFAQAEQAYRRAVELSDRLAADFPRLPGYRWTAIDRRCALAGFLVETGRVPEALRVFAATAGLIEKLAPPDRARAMMARGHFYAGLGDWNKATAAWTKAIELGSDDVLGVWCPLALVQLAAGRTDEYRSLCEKMLKHSENHWVIGICTLAPKAVADPSRPVRIAEKLVAREPKNAACIMALGLALYRKGDLERAVERLEMTIHSGAGFHIQASKLVLAMAYHRLGRRGKAQQLFQEVTRWLEMNAEKLKEGAAGGHRLAWAYRLGLQVLHHEAQEVLQAR
jgi:tetratricopeptide (TPR) repeat protein